MFQALDGSDMDPYENDPADTDMMEASALFQAASQRFEELFQGLPFACFCFDTRGQLLEWNRSSTALFHKNTESVLQQPVCDVIGRTEDREITQALINSVLAGATYEHLEWEDTTLDGPTRHFLSNLFPLRDGVGNVIGGVSASIDISERKHAEFALRESEERWQLALRGTNDGIWDLNVRTGVAFYSTRWKQMLGYDDLEIGTTREEWVRIMYADDAPAVLQAFQSHLDGQTEFYSAEYRVKCRNGSYKWILDRGQALWNRSGEAVRVAGSFTDVTERKRAEQQLHEVNQRLEAMATEDGLTGLKNHRAFQERLTLEYGRAPRYNLPLTLVLLDVDHFKQFNDTFGHPAGDQVLKRVATLLQQNVRETDLVARYGGEEFVLILPHTDQEGARTVADRCRTAIATAPWAFRAVTASFGVATLHAGISSPAELITTADRALYAAKANGRNCISYTPKPETPASS